MAYLGHCWDDYQLLLYDKSRAYLGDLTHVRRLRYSKSAYGEGSFSFAVHVQDRFASLLSTQALTYVVIKRSGLTVFEGFTQKPAHRYAQDQQGLDEYIEVSGVCLAKMLDWRYAWDTTGHMEITDHVDDIMKAVVDGSIGPGAPAAPDASVRALTGFAVAADKHEAANKTLDPKNANLGEWLRKTGQAYSVDFDVYFDASMDFVFETWYPRRGDDRSEINTDGNTPVIINDAGYNVQGANAYWDSYQLRNAVILEDGSNATADAASINNFERREMLAKSTDSNRLDTFLAENELDAGCQFDEFMESVDCEWGTHFFLGDLLTWNNIHLGMTTAKHQLLSSIEAEIDDDDLEHLKLVFIESGESPDGEPDEADRMGGGGSGGDWGWDLPWAEASGIMPVQAACGAGTDLYIPRADHEHKFLLVTAGGNVSPTAGAAGGEITFVAGAGIAFTVAANSLTIAATGGHDPVTLDATIDANLLSLTGQELGLDDQNLYTAFMGPVAGGGAAPPSFRGIQDIDLQGGGICTASYYLMTNGDGTMQWVDPATNHVHPNDHVPVTLDATIEANLLGITGQELGLDAQTANYVFAGPTSGVAAAPAFRGLIDSDLGGSRAAGYVLVTNGLGVCTWTAPATATHAAVTLDATIDANLLSLTGQELGLDTQAANYVFCGPETGAAAAPAFRKLVYADVATIVPSNTHHHHNTWTSADTDGLAALSHSITYTSTLSVKENVNLNHVHTIPQMCMSTELVGTPYEHHHLTDSGYSTGYFDATHKHEYDKATSIADHAAHHHHYDKSNEDTSGPK